MIRKLINKFLKKIRKLLAFSSNNYFPIFFCNKYYIFNSHTTRYIRGTKSYDKKFEDSNNRS